MVSQSLSELDSLIKSNSLDGIEVLRPAIGSDVFVSYCLLKRVKREEIIDNLQYVKDPRCAHGIVRYCPGAYDATLVQKNQRKSFKPSIRISAQILKVFWEFYC